MISATVAAHPWVAEAVGGVRFGISTFPLPDWATTRDLAQTIEALGR